MVNELRTAERIRVAMEVLAERAPDGGYVSIDRPLASERRILPQPAWRDELRAREPPVRVTACKPLRVELCFVRRKRHPC